MDNYPFLDSQINFDFMSEFSSFLNEVAKGDYTYKFSTDQIFPSRAELIEWVRKIAFDLGFAVVIIRSDTTTGEPERKTFILLGCERSEKYKPDVQPSVSGTRKCECPFRLRGKPKGQSWVFKVMCGYHNHELAETLYGHPFVGRLNVVEQSILVDMTKSQDTTYKTNKYRLLLLEIVRVTSIGLTFIAVFAFFSSERQNNFTWALERFKGLLLTSKGGPRVVVTDRDLTLMNVIDNVFPETYQMLYTFHIMKNVKAKCNMLVDNVEAWDVLMEV
ncbi:uncharacterized protein LOC124840032 [Vigna umbellata]|uniref:uncharacterized protein LOC124840032 n=1 Tax=Vigna umbellata TaxID=87088 RepID=UPI001F5FEFFF|nr:uncharacterized protein LOC124840032 [Vigna umbellata]